MNQPLTETRVNTFFDQDENLLAIREGVSKVVVTPLGNGDFANGMDDVQVSTTPINLCDVDLNCDGNLDFFDVSEFIAAYNAMDPRADFLPDGEFNFFDVSIYISQYNAGCP